MTTTRTQTPAFGQTVGYAQRALNALLKTVLAETDTSFQTWVVLSILGTRGPAMARDALRHDLAVGLELEPAAVDELLERVASEGLIAIASDGTVEPTAAGATLYLRLRRSASELTAQVVRDLDPDDVQTTIAVLQSATARAEVLLGR
jgi:DNA-binding MarR family transcriptional regulator